MKKKTVGVIVGRFQTPYLHEGHRALIELALTKNDEVLVLLGCPGNDGDRKNPLDFRTRQKMLNHIYPVLKVDPVFDHPCDKVWSEKLDAIVNSLFPKAKITLYGGRDSFIERYHGKLPRAVLPSYGNSSASKLRREIVLNPGWTHDFRAGVIYAQHHKFAKIVPTVDIAVVDYGDNPHCPVVLLGSKYPGDLRFPGGFVDPADETLEMAARRELMEEVKGLNTPWPLEFVGSTQVDSWRYGDGPDTIMTSLFYGEYGWGSPEASDDLAECEWFPLNKDTFKKISKEHKKLYRMLMKFVKEKKNVRR